MLSSKSDIIPIDGFVGWFRGLSGLKGLNSTITSMLDSQKKPLESAYLEVSPDGRVGEC